MKSATNSFPSEQEIEERLAFIISVANRSASVILPYFRGSYATENKDRHGRFDPVTEADRAGEKFIRELIIAHYPEDAILGEEYGSKEGSSAYCWIIDPIDGTRSFVTGIPLWGTLIGLTYRSRSFVGVMNQPYTNELFYGSPAGAYLFRNGRKLRLETRHCTELADAQVANTAAIFSKTDDSNAFERIRKAANMVRHGGDCYLYAMLAAGQIDLVIESGLKSYDIAAMIPIVENAGGIITTWEGTSASKGGCIIAAGCQVLHEAAISLLRA